MGVRKQSMNRRCLQLAMWLLEYNPLWGEGVLAGPLHSILMSFQFSFYVSFILWAEVPPFLNGGILKRLPTMISITIIWKMPKNGENKLFFIENACIFTSIWSKLCTVIKFGLIFIILSKLNSKQVCKKTLFMKNKCGTTNDHNNIWNWNRHMSKFVILNLSCLLESVVLWRHLVAIKRQGDIRLTFVADNRPMAFLSNWRIVETSTPSLLAISICFNLFLFALHKCPQTLSFCELHHVELNDCTVLVLFYIYKLFCSFLKRKTVHLFLFMEETFTKSIFL